MAGKTISLRLDPVRLDRADAYARKRGWTRTQVVEAGLDALWGDVQGGVPEAPTPSKAEAPAEQPRDPFLERQREINETERVPTPEEKGTAHWRDPTEEEISDVLYRHPFLSRPRAERMARAEAFQRDRGLMPPVGPQTRVSRPIEEGDRKDVHPATFDKVTAARAMAFSKLRAPESSKGKQKSGEPPKAKS